MLASTSPRGWLQGTRAYDDYELYVTSRNNVDRAAEALGHALAEYDLMLNPHKFLVLELPSRSRRSGERH